MNQIHALAGLVNCCHCMKVVPRPYEEGLTTDVELESTGLLLFLSGKCTQTEFPEIMDIALRTRGDFPGPGGTAKYCKEVKLESHK
jgi:hypothetical protein